MSVSESVALADSPHVRERGRWNVPAALLAAVIFAGLSFTLAITSKGFLEGDSITHYSMARFALKEHHYLVSVWGRPLITCLYVFPAQYGPIGVRLVSLTLALLCGFVTYRIASEQGFRWPALAVICLFAQPVFFLHSFSELTELPFATVLILAFWAYQRRQFLLMAILVAFTPLARPEGFGFLLLAGLALIAQRRWYWLWVLPIPVLVWSYAGWTIYGRPAIHWWVWLPHNWPYSSNSPYGHGPPYHYLLLLPALVSPFLFPALGIGVWRMVRKGAAGIRTRRHLDLCKLWIAAIPLLMLAVHSLLWWRGLQASSGELRYLVIVSPMWALLCAAGWEWVFVRFRLRGPLICAGVAALLPALVNVYYPFLPLPQYAQDKLGNDVARWYKADADIQARYPKMMASLPSVYFYLDMSSSAPSRTAAWGMGNVLANGDGTVAVWDPVYGQHNSDAGLCVPEQMLLDPKNGWVFLRRYDEGGDYDHRFCLIFLSRRDIHGDPTPPMNGGSPDLRTDE